MANYDTSKWTTTPPPPRVDASKWTTVPPAPAAPDPSKINPLLAAAVPAAGLGAQSPAVKALQTASQSPVGQFAGRHPNITAGTIGGGLALAGFPEDIPVLGAEAAPVARGIYGAASGVGWQKLSEWAQRAAQHLAPNHPLVGELAGILAPLAGGQLESRALGGADVAARAAGAAEKAEAAVKVPEGGLEESIPQAQAQMQVARQDADRQMAEQTAKLRESEAQKVLPEAKAAAIGKAAGRTPEETQRAIAGGELERTPEGASLPGPAMVGRQQGFWRSVIDPIHQMSTAAGDQYDKLWTPHLNDAVNATSLGSAVDEEAAYASQQGITYSAPVQKLLDRAKQLATGPDILSKYYSEEDLAGLTPMQRSNLEAGTRKMIAEGQARLATTSRQTIYKPGEAAAETVAEPTGPSIAKLRGLRTDASNLVASSTNGRDKAAAQNIVEAVDKTLESSNVLNPAEQKTLQALNAKYRTYKTIFDRSLLRKVGGSAEPVDAAGEIFDDPKRARLLIANADKDQLSVLRETYADWVNHKGAGVIDPGHSAFLGELFPNTPFRDPKAWIFQDKAIDHLADVIQSDPNVRNTFNQGIADGMAKEQLKYAQTLVAQARTDSKLFGPLGKKLRTDMLAAEQKGGAKAAADVATKFYQTTTPEEAQTALTQARAGAGEQAGIAELQKGYKPTQFWQTSKRRALYFVAPYLMVGGLMDHLPTFALGGAMGAGIGGTREMLVRMTQNALRDPAAARSAYNALLHAGEKGSMNAITQGVARAMIADALAKQGIATSEAEGTGASSGGPLAGLGAASAYGAEGPPTKTGPGVTTAGRLRAEQIAPTSSGADRAEKLENQLAGTTPPDVHNDLRSGRLSVDEAKRLVQHASDPRFSRVLASMPIQDAVHAVEVASPQEKEVLLPILQNRLRQEMPQIKNQTTQSNLAQRLRRLQMPPAAADATAIV